MVGYQILTGLAERGHAVRTLSPIPEEVFQAEPVAFRHPDIDVTWYKVPYAETNDFFPVPAKYLEAEAALIQRELPRLIVAERPHVIIIGRETFAWHVPDIAIHHSVPSILLLHGGTTWGILNGTYADAVALQFIEQCRKANLIVTSATHFADSMRTIGLDTVKTVLNPVNLDHFYPTPKDQALLRELAINEHDIVVLHVANLKAIKRPFDIVDSAERTLQQNPSLVYVVLGDGTLRAAMEESCRQKQISERFRFVGWVDHARVPAFINLADMVAMPSDTEVQALVYLETQACGRLLLASDIPGAHEVIDDGETGLLFRKGDVGDLTAKTLLAAGDTKLRAEIGRKARERVKFHDVTLTIAAYEATLESVIKEYRR